MSPHTLDDYHKHKAEIKKEVKSELKSEYAKTLEALMRGQDDLHKVVFATNQKLDEIATSIAPVIKWFNDYNGFKVIGITWLKTLALIGSAILGLYAIIEFLNKLRK